MNIVKNTFSISPLRFTAVFMGMAAVWLFAPEIVHAAVTFGEMGENVADNAKGVAKGITLAGYAAGAGMGVWGTVDMYKATKNQGQSTYAGGLTKVVIGSGTRPGRTPRFRFRYAVRKRPDFRHGRIGPVSVRR